MLTLKKTMRGRKPCISQSPMSVQFLGYAGTSTPTSLSCSQTGGTEARQGGPQARAQSWPRPATSPASGAWSTPNPIAAPLQSHCINHTPAIQPIHPPSHYLPHPTSPLTLGTSLHSLQSQGRCKEKQQHSLCATRPWHHRRSKGSRSGNGGRKS